MDALRPLSLDQFAALTAEMEAGLARDRVLADAAISGEQWELTQETWLLRMAKQGSQRKLALLDRYNELLAKHRKAAQRKMRAEKRKLKGPMPVPPEAHLSPLARIEEGGTGATFQKPGFGEPPEQRAFAPPPEPPAAQPAWHAAPAVPPPGAATPPMPMMAVPQIADAPPPGFAGPAARDPGGPAWMQKSKRPRTLLASTVTHEGGLPPGAASGPAWLSAKPQSRAEEPKPAPSAAAAPLPGGPAWLQSSSLVSSPIAPAPAQPGAQPVVSPTAQPIAPPQAAPKVDLGRTMSADSETRPPKVDLGRTMSADSETRPAAFAMGISASDRAAWIAALDRPSEGEGAPAPAPAGALPFQRVSPPAKEPAPPQVGALPFQRVSPPAKEPAPPQAGALPFQRVSPPAKEPAPAQAGALPFQRVNVQPQEPAPGPAPARAGALPFQPASPQPAAQPIARPTPPPFAKPTPPPIASPVAPAAAPAQPVVRPTPPGAPAPAPRPRLSLEQLAWLQAQVDASAELGRSAREQLGLSEADYATERATWQAQLQSDRGLVERYSQLFYHYRRALGR